MQDRAAIQTMFTHRITLLRNVYFGRYLAAWTLLVVGGAVFVLLLLPLNGVLCTTGYACAVNLLGSYATPYNAGDVFVSGSCAYVTHRGAIGNGGLAIIDISNPENPQVMASYDVWPSEHVFVSGSYAYLTVGSGFAAGGLRIIDISNPADPFLVGSCNTAGYAIDVFVSGDYAYIANGKRGLQVVDISDPTTPKQIGSYYPRDFPGYHGVHVLGSIAYIASSFGLELIDVSDPTNPRPLGSCATTAQADGIYVAGSYAYLTGGHASIGVHYIGLQIADISDPVNPRLVGSLNISDITHGVWVLGSYAYVGTSYSGLRIIDVSAATNPSLVASCPARSWVDELFVLGSYIYAVAGDSVHSGLGIYEFRTKPYHTVSAPDRPTGPSAGQVRTILTFSTSGSTCSEGHSVQYRINWGDGSYSNWSSTADSAHAYLTAGTYEVRAQARSLDDPQVVSSWSIASIVSISISPSSENSPPIADAGPNRFLFDKDRNGNEQLALDASSSKDLDGEIRSYVWKEGGIQVAVGPTPTVILPVGGHTITLMVTDDKGATASDDVAVIIASLEREEEPTCAIDLVERGSSTPIDVVGIGEFFDIRITTSAGSPKSVRFSSDESQDNHCEGEWTNWFDWNTCSTDWNADTKTKAWSFATSGDMEIWAEIKESEGGYHRCFAHISVQETFGPKDGKKAEMTEALWTLKEAMLQKVDHDISVTAQGFTSVKDYWRVKRWADIFRVPLRILEDTISILTKLADWRNIKHLSGSEAACQVLLSMAMIQDLRQVGNNLICALDGPAYIESVKRMLAAAEATTGLRDFSPTHYRRVVENWLNGLGEVPVLLLPKKVAGEAKEGFVAGALAVKLSIMNQFNDLTRNILNTDFAEGFPFEEVTARIEEISKGIIASSAAEQTIEYPIPSNGEFQSREIKLGAVAGLYRVFGEVAGCVVEHVEIEQTVEVIKLLETGTNAVLLYTTTHKIPGAEDVKVVQQVFTLAGVLTGSYVHTFVENPEKRFYELPQEMLLMLPVELTNLWMVAESVVSYIKDSLR